MVWVLCVCLVLVLFLMLFLMDIGAEHPKAEKAPRVPKSLAFPLSSLLLLCWFLCNQLLKTQLGDCPRFPKPEELRKKSKKTKGEVIGQ